MDIDFSPETDGVEELELVRDDTIAGLRDWFDPVEGDDPWAFRADLSADGLVTNGSFTAVAWRYRAQPRQDVWGVAADRGPVAIDGVSFVGADPDTEEPTFSRYIDWHGAFTQMGVAAAGHVIVGDDTVISSA